jgi:hypothetical protein
MQESDFKTIRDLVAAAETEAALETLVKLLSKNGEDKDFLDECFKIQAQQFQLKQEEIRGILSVSKTEQRRNLINHRLFELLKQIEKGEKPGNLSFKKQNPLLFYTLHVVASLAICGLLGLFVNEGFVSGREDWELVISVEGKWFWNLVIVFLVGLIPSFFAIMTCFQFLPFMIETGFAKSLRDRRYYLFYGNFFYYIIPSKFVIFHQIIVSATLTFWALLLLSMGFAFWLWIVFQGYKIINKSPIPIKGFLDSVNENRKEDDIAESLVKHPFISLFSILAAFFAYYAVGHPIAVTIYNFL